VGSSSTHPLVRIQRLQADGEVVVIAVGYERAVELQETGDGQTGDGQTGDGQTGDGQTRDGQEQRWTERRLVVRSVQRAAAAERSLRTRLAEAQAEVAALGERRRGKSRPANWEALDQAMAAILQRYQVEEVLRVEVTEEWGERTVRAYNGRPAHVKRSWDFHLHAKVDEEALAARIARLGWRVYATNQPAAELSLEQAVLTYREEYLIEHSFARLKGAPLSLRPCYLQRDDHAQGLVRLLALGLRVLSLLEFGVRRQLAKEGTSLGGLYKGQPTQPTATTRRPTAERLLEQFEEVTLTIIEHAGQRLYHLTSLSEVQRRIVALPGFTTDIYTKLVADSAQPP
jgi:transposase